MAKQFKPPADYEKKYAGFIQTIKAANQAGDETLLIDQPWALGDNYEEIIESLSRLADAGLMLQVAYRAGRPLKPPFAKDQGGDGE